MSSPDRSLLEYAGGNLYTEVALPSLRVSAAPDSTIRLRVLAPTRVERLPDNLAWQHNWLASDGSSTLQHTLEGPNRHRLRAPGLCDFLVGLSADSATIETEHDTDLPADTLEHLLLDQILPRALSDLGELVIHASCSVMDGRGVLFLGDSGWGKSTLASLLRQRSHPTLSDDCVVLRIHQGKVQAIPSYPSLRLFDDSAAQAGIPATQLSRVAAYTGKRRVALQSDPAPASASIDAIYLLNDPAQPCAAVRLDRLHAKQACMALIGQGFRLDLAARQRHSTFLAQAAAIAGHVPAFALAYPRTYDHADALVALLSAQCTQQASPTRPQAGHAHHRSAQSTSGRPAGEGAPQACDGGAGRREANAKEALDSPGKCD